VVPRGQGSALLVSRRLSATLSCERSDPLHLGSSSLLVLSARRLAIRGVCFLFAAAFSDAQNQRSKEDAA